MDFEVKIIADSVNQKGERLTTLTATYPRIIHSELLTHRAFARNAASSRAIPHSKMQKMIIDSPFIPIYWGMENRGMQTGDEVPEHMRDFAEYLWCQAMQYSVHWADMLANIGKHFVERFPSKAMPGDENVRMHKSIPNRLTEPYMWITSVISATEWKNFFRLRCHEDAEVHFQKIANMIRETREASKPKSLAPGEWHLPFIHEDELGLPIDTLSKVSTARSARVSYLNHEGKRDIASDLDMFERLCNGSGFGHWSAHEHCAAAGAGGERSGPFVGWLQFRKNFENENLAG